MPTNQYHKQYQYVYGNQAYDAASNSKLFSSWYPILTTPNEDVYDIYEIRARSRDLGKNNPIAKGIVQKMVDYSVGKGLRVIPDIDEEALGISQDEKMMWEKDVKSRFEYWASSSKSDFLGVSDFYSLQSLAMTQELFSGDAFLSLNLDRMGNFSCHLLESDRIDTPYDMEGMNDVSYGVKRDKKNGRPQGYYVLNNFESSRNLYSWIFFSKDYTYVPKIGSRTKRQNIVHYYNVERSGRLRGIPFLAPVMTSLKQLSRFTSAELTSAILNSYIVGTISSGDPDNNPTANLDTYTRENRDGKEVTIDQFEQGMFFHTSDDSRIEFPSKNNLSVSFTNFFNTICTEIGAGIGIPKEVMLSSFMASYSASQASLLQAKRTFMIKRDDFARNFCQIVYKEWLRNEIMKGEIKAPSFSEGEYMMDSWCRAKWNGDAMGHIDPVKEATAMTKRLEAGVTSLSQEIISFSGMQTEDVSNAKKKDMLIFEQKELPNPYESKEESQMKQMEMEMESQENNNDDNDMEEEEKDGK